MLLAEAENAELLVICFRTSSSKCVARRHSQLISDIGEPATARPQMAPGAMPHHLTARTGKCPVPTGCDAYAIAW